MHARAISSLYHQPRLPWQQVRERLLKLPLIQPVKAEQELSDLLGEALLSPPGEAELMDALEQVRGALCFVREAAVRHYLEEAPLLDEERERHFRRGIESTYRMLQCYKLCAYGIETRRGSGQDRRLAAALHRSLYYSGRLIFEHHRAKREMPAGTWAEHCAFFDAASRAGIAGLPVEDRIFDESRSSHCQAAFVAPLLAEQANPYGRSPRDLNFIWRWAEELAPLVGVSPGEPAPLPAYGVTLGQDTPLLPRHLADSSDRMCRLDTTAATARLRRILEDLERGLPPERYGLCPENLRHSTRLLAELADLWSLQDTQRRRHPRRPEKGSTRVCLGFQAMHQLLLGANAPAAKQPPFRQLESLSTPAKEEHWEILDRSQGGFRLACAAPQSRLAAGQLIALCPQDGAQCLLGRIAWLRRDQAGRLQAGISLFTGLPLAVYVRPMSLVKGGKSSLVRAFLFPDEPPQTPPALVLPTDIPRQGSLVGSEIEVLHDRYRKLLVQEEAQREPEFIRLICSTG